MTLRKKYVNKSRIKTTCVDNMDIISLSMSLAQTQLQTEVGTAVLDQSMNLTQDMSEGLKQMMEQSVTPYLGGSIDVTL